MNRYDITDIRQVLERYYRGDTTEAEESMLRAYFAGDDVDSGLEADRDIFLSLSRSEERRVGKECGS